MVAALAIVAGAGLIALAWGREQNALILTVGGAFLLALGILLAAPLYVPPLVRLAAALPARASVTARLAGANAARNPRRTAATCLALMLTVGLIVTMQVGAASTKASAEAGLADRYPVPIAVASFDQAGLPKDLASRIARVDGVGAVIPVRGGELTGDNASHVLGVGADLSQVAPGERVWDDEVLFDPATVQGRGWRAGDLVPLTGDRGSVALRLRPSHLSTGEPVVSGATLDRLVRTPVIAQVWASVPAAGPEAAKGVVSAVQDIVADLPTTFVTGSLAELVVMRQALDALLAITTALLGVAVLIALIGVGNTLGLSVLERTRESALLRALGLRRAQLRRMLAVEALLLALVGALIGIVAGIGFGYLGARALLAEMQQPVVFAMSGWQTVVDVTVATVAGLLASVLPARRALRAAPTQALAEV